MARSPVTIGREGGAVFVLRLPVAQLRVASRQGEERSPATSHRGKLILARRSKRLRLLPVTLISYAARSHFPTAAAACWSLTPCCELLRGIHVFAARAKAIAALAPSSRPRWIQNQQQLTIEIREFRRVGGGLRFLRAAGYFKASVEKSRITGRPLRPQKFAMWCWWWNARRNGGRSP